jgi:RHS repeat-associated protein
MRVAQASSVNALTPGSSTIYYHGDQIGSTRMQTDGAGSVISTSEYYPFGQGPQPTSQNHYLFSGKERDAESGLDYFGARYYASGLGRFMSADWSAQAEPVPYAKLDDPQTLNLYAYARNNPISLVDPDGHNVIEYNNYFFPLFPNCELHRQIETAKKTKEGEAYQAQGDAFNAAQQQSDKNTDVMLMSNHANPQYSQSNNAGQVEVEWHIVPQANNISAPQLQKQSTDATAEKYSGASVLLDESRRTAPQWHWEGSHTGSGLDHFDQSALPANQKWYINTGGGNNSSNQRIQVVVGMKPDGTLVKAWTVHVEWGRNGPVYSKID